MAKPQPAQPKPSLLKSPLIPGIILAVVFAIAIGSQAGLIKLPHFGPSAVHEISEKATIGVPSSYDFEELISLLNPNYNGDRSGYTFYLGSGTGFPPMGLILGIDGVLRGTPTGTGGNFEVCVKDVGGNSACRTYHLTVNSAAGNNNNNNNNVQPSDSFVGDWATLSPATYYEKDIDGERYVAYSANFHLNIKKQWKGYLGSGWIDTVSYKKIPGAVTPIVPMVPNPGGPGYYSPVSFDATGYFAPQPGISSLEVSGDKMIVTTPLSGGTEKIVLTLVKTNEKIGGKDNLDVTLSVIPTSSGQSMGDETDTPIILVRK